MTDINKMSAEELYKVATGGSDGPKPVKSTPEGKVDLNDLSTVELFTLATSDDPTVANELVKKIDTGINDYVVKPIAKVGAFVDKYTGAPARSAIGAMQDGKSGLKAFGSQFGKDPAKAPTGKDIAVKAGLSDESKISGPFKSFETGGYIPTTPAAVAGLGIDVAADPTNLIPFGAAPKVFMKGAKLAGSATKLAAKGTAGLTDLATGTKFASKGLDAVENVAEGAKLATSKLFSPKVSKDFPDYLEIAKRNNIPQDLLPSATEFGDTSVITRAERGIAEGPLGQKLLEKHEQGLQAVRDATEKQIQKVSGGKILSKQEAGSYIRQAYDEAVDQKLGQYDVTYNKIVKDYPGLSLSTGFAAGDKHLDTLASKLNGIEKFAQGRLKRGITGVQEEQAKRLLKAVNAIRASNGSFKQSAEALRDIGEAAFKSQNTLAAIPADIEKMRELYGSLHEAMIATVRQSIGDDVAETLLKNNKELTEFISNKNPLAKVIGDKNLSDEAVFRNLIENGDSQKLASLKMVFGEERLKPIKGAWLNSLLKRDLDQSFNFRPLVGTLRNKQIVLNNLLDPSEVKEFADIVRLGDSFGQPILSTSGTGASNIFRDMKSGLVNSVINEATVSGLKNKARGQLPNISQVTLEQPDSIAARIQMIKGLDPRNLKRGPREKLLKSSQVISVQDRNKEKDEDNALRRRIEAMRNNQ